MEIRQQERADGTTVVELEGELDLATAPAARDSVIDAIATDGDGVAVDMSACTFIDSTGLRILVEAGRLLQRDGRRLELIGLRDQPLKIFELALGGRWEMFRLTERDG